MSYNTQHMGETSHHLTTRNARVIIVFVVIATIICTGCILYIRTTKPDKPTAYLTQDIPVYLAGDLHQLDRTITALDASLERSDVDAAEAASVYASQLADIIAACGRVDGYRAAIGAADPQGQPAAVVLQAKTMCDDLRDVTRYSQAQYAAVAPLLRSSTQIRRFEHWPLFSAHKEQQLRQSYGESLRALKMLPAAPDIDASSTVSLRSTIETAKSESERTSHLDTLSVTLRDTQTQVLAERVSYWRSYVGIDSLRKAIRNQLVNVCGELATRNQPFEACRR